MPMRFLIVLLATAGATLVLGGAKTGQAQIRLGPMSSAVWPDGSVQVAIALVNTGGRAASAVTISSVALGDAKLLSAPAALRVGNIAAGQRAVMQVRFGSVETPGTYTIKITGHFQTRTHSKITFSLAGKLSVNSSAAGSAEAAPGAIAPRQTLGKPGTPPLTRPFQGVNPAGPPIPDGPPANRKAAPRAGSSKPKRTHSKRTKFRRPRSANRPKPMPNKKLIDRNLRNGVT
jgi:hypothetical protein